VHSWFAHPGCQRACSKQGRDQAQPQSSQAKHTCVPVRPHTPQPRSRSCRIGRRGSVPAASPFAGKLKAATLRAGGRIDADIEGEVNGNRWTSLEQHDLYMTVFFRPLMLPRVVAVHISSPLLFKPKYAKLDQIYIIK
jgi:hypothetical protein